MYPSFFKNLGPIKIKSIKELIKCNIHRINDNSSFTNFTGIKELREDGLSFLSDIEFSEEVKYPDGTILCSTATYKKFRGLNPLIEVEDLYLAVAIISNMFYRSLNSYEIDLLKKPEIGNNCKIAKNAIIEKGSIIGKNVNISPGCVVGYNTIIGDNSSIDSNTVISNSIIAENVKIGRNVSIGQNGFGFAVNKNENVRIFHKGRVILQTGVNIGSNCSIDRGSFRDTVIGENTYFDNLCHVAHNVIIGNNCMFAAMSGIAGSAIIGNNVMTGGQIGIAGHLKIGNNVQIAAQSGVLNDLTDNSIVMGHPAINKFKYIKNFKKNNA